MKCFKHTILFQFYFLMYVNISRTKTIHEIGEEYKSWIESIPDLEKQNVILKGFLKWFDDAKSRETRLLRDAKSRERQLLNEVNDRNKKIHNAKVWQLMLKPPALVEDIEDDFIFDYDWYIKGIQQQFNQCTEYLEFWNEQLAIDENELKNPHLSEDERKSWNGLIVKIKDNLESKQREKDTLAELIPPQGSNITERIRSSYLRWKWALNHKADNQRISKILEKIKEKYNEKPAAYKNAKSLEKYKDEFCLNIANVRENSLIRAANVFPLISVEENFEFDQINIFGGDMDEFITILINAVGIRHPPPNGSIVVYRKRQTTSL